MKTVLFVGGGSVGHIAPSVAVARELQKIASDAAPLFLCGESAQEKDFLETEGFLFSTCRVPRMNAKFPASFFRAYKTAMRLFRERDVGCVFSKGGSLSVPVCMAARKRGIPIILHESDAVLGRANRMIANWANSVCLGMPLRQEHSPHFVITGNPIRSETTEGNKEEGERITGFRGDRPVLLVIGGSQGAEALNDAVIDTLDSLVDRCDVIHLTGRGKEGADPRTGYWSKEFAQQELPHLYKIATIALTRAGAGVISELAANGIPVILVPIRGLAHDHQLLNAEVVVEKGGGMILSQQDLSRLPKTVENLLANEDTLREMSRHIRSMHYPEAARLIAEMIAKYIA